MAPGVTSAVFAPGASRSGESGKAGAGFRPPTRRATLGSGRGGKSAPGSPTAPSTLAGWHGGRRPRQLGRAGHFPLLWRGLRPPCTLRAPAGREGDRRAGSGPTAPRTARRRLPCPAPAHWLPPSASPLRASRTSASGARSARITGMSALTAGLPDRLDALEQLYRDLHEHPELAFREERTA